jgi:hypothetical protein
MSILAACVAWVHPFTYAFLFFTIIIYILLLRKSEGVRRVAKYLFLSSALALLPLIPNLGNVFNDVVYEAPSFFQKSPVTLYFYTSEIVMWTGGVDALAVITALGLLILWNRFRLTKEIDLLAPISWIVATFVLFNFSFLLSPFLNDWYVYADRSLLLLPASFMISIAVCVFCKNIGRWIRSWI